MRIAHDTGHHIIRICYTATKQTIALVPAFRNKLARANPIDLSSLSSLASSFCSFLVRSFVLVA